MSSLILNRLNSSWTPLNREDLNLQIFQERRTLVGKWFEKWSDSQRLAVLEDLFGKCRVKQLEQASALISRRKPTMHDDFTRVMPRVISLYIFAFLDPRSLSRCAQVCWHWKYLTEVDQLWMAKCVRLGWTLSFSPSPYESGVWKRLYIENIVALKRSTPLAARQLLAKEMDKSDVLSTNGTPRPKSAVGKKPPWRGSDPVPKDIQRNNYLENDDESVKVQKLRKKAAYGTEASDIHRRAKTKLNTGLNSLQLINTMTRSKSAMGLSEYGAPSDRPDWAKTQTTGPASTFVNRTNYGDVDPKAAAPKIAVEKKRPATDRGAASVLSTRSARDPPSTDLFPANPWAVSAKEEDYDSDVY